MSSLDESRIATSDLYKGLNIITELLKDIKNAVKDDLVLSMKFIKATKAYTKNSPALTELLDLVKNFDFQGLKSSVESIQATALRQDEYLALWANVPPTTLAIIKLPATIRGRMILRLTLKNLLLILRGHVAMEDDKAKEEPTRKVALIESSSKPLITDPILEILLTEEKIQAHMDKEEQNNKAAEEAKMFEMTKTEVIKVVQEEAEKIRLDPKIIISVKACEKESVLPALVPGQAPSRSSGRRKHMELEPKIKVPGLECNRSLPKGVSFVNNMVIEEPEYGIFFTDVFGDQAFQK
nr:copia protein [Tanacetum cinerariifolium]